MQASNKIKIGKYGQRQVGLYTFVAKLPITYVT